jgi:hypothetical protein
MRRRGMSLLWSVAALAVAAAMTPLFVSLCTSLARVTSRGGLRIRATQRGEAELERVRAGHLRIGTNAAPELPSGAVTVTRVPGPSPRLALVQVRVTWDEGGRTAAAEWTTLAETRR